MLNINIKWVDACCRRRKKEFERRETVYPLTHQSRHRPTLYSARSPAREMEGTLRIDFLQSSHNLGSTERKRSAYLNLQQYFFKDTCDRFRRECWSSAFYFFVKVQTPHYRNSSVLTLLGILHETLGGNRGDPCSRITSGLAARR